MHEILIPNGPFDFSKMLQRPMSRPSKLMAIDPDTLSMTRTIRLANSVVPMTVSSGGSVDQPMLALSYPDQLSLEEREQLRARICRMLSTDIDIVDFYQAMECHEQWKPLIQQMYGLRPIQDADLFETMVKAIIGQQINVQFAATLLERFIQYGGEWVEWNGEELSVFPGPEQVSNWAYEDLQALSFSERKAQYVIDFARATVNGRVNLERVWHMTDDEIFEQLVSLRGIGRWTVECLLLFGMGRLDIIPGADIGVQKAIQILYELPHRPRDAEVRRMAEAWAPWRSLATYYLWQSLIRSAT